MQLSVYIITLNEEARIENTIKQAAQTAQKVENGDLTTRILENPHNPQLVELREVLNKMLDALQRRVGSNMNIIHDVFESYKMLDFTKQIPNASGNVEVTTNILGEEIRKNRPALPGHINFL